MPRQFLAEFFARHCSPALRTEGTRVDYDGTVRLFCRLVGDVACSRIDAELIETFRDRAIAPPRRQLQLELPFDGPVQGDQLLLFEPGFPTRRNWVDRKRLPQTVNKHVRTLGTILRKYWRMQGQPQRAPEVAGICLPEEKPMPRDPTDEELAAIYTAADRAVYPVLGDTPPADWWQSFMALAITTGFRRRALLGLCWRWIDFGRRVVRLPKHMDKCHRDRTKPLNLVAVQHLMRLRADRELVLPWPHSRRTLDRQWHRIQTAAGLAEYDHLRVHDLKGVCATRMNEVGSVFAAMHQCDHSQVTTTQRYVGVTREQREAVEAMRLPACFYGASG